MYIPTSFFCILYKIHILFEIDQFVSLVGFVDISMLNYVVLRSFVCSTCYRRGTHVEPS